MFGGALFLTAEGNALCINDGNTGLRMYYSHEMSIGGVLRQVMVMLVVVVVVVVVVDTKRPILQMSYNCIIYK